MKAPEELFRTMARIRRFEELAGEQFQAGAIPGTVHLSIGQEGIATGIGSALMPGDRSTSTHRGHGDLIAAGSSLEGMFAELLGRSTGFCGGKGGSMHVADPSVGSLGANGIVGGGIPIAVGSALSSQLLGDGAVTVAFFGDGAVNAGSFHESLNLARVWNLPVVFVCENNLFAQFTRTERLLAATSICDRARSYGLQSLMVDGSDVVAVYRTAVSVMLEVREGSGPQFIEGRCFRIRGHNETDSLFLGRQRYRSDREIEEYTERDPLKVIVEHGHLTAEAAMTIQQEVAEEVEDALNAALQAPFPVARDAYLRTRLVVGHR